MRWLLLLLAIGPTTAQDAPVERKRPVEIETLVDRAQPLPPEFSADLHLKLAASPLITHPKWKRELIEEAFFSGARAPLPYRQRGEPHTDSRTAKQVDDNGLEALTLQTRAVEAMLSFDPQRALAMYQAIAAPDLPRVPCTDIITPNVEAWYNTAAKVFRACLYGEAAGEGRRPPFSEAANCGDAVAFAGGAIAAVDLRGQDFR